MPADVFRQGFAGKIDAMRQRLVDQRRRPGIVAADEHAARLRRLHDGGDILHLHRSGAGAFHPDELCSVVDQPGDCDFTLPAILDRDPVLIAIGTGGASAGLAKALRQRLETLLPARLGALATALATARGAIRARWADPADRRRAIDAALEAGGSLDPLTPDSATRVDAWLAADAAAATRDRLEICTIASADPDQLTLQVARWLASADSVFHQPGIAPAILDRARADARRIAHPGPALPNPEGLSLYLVTR